MSELIKVLKSIDVNLSWIVLFLFFITISQCSQCGVQKIRIIEPVEPIKIEFKWIDDIKEWFKDTPANEGDSNG